jgi:hypothetical protein
MGEFGERIRTRSGRAGRPAPTSSPFFPFALPCFTCLPDEISLIDCSA